MVNWNIYFIEMLINVLWRLRVAGRQHMSGRTFLQEGDHNGENNHSADQDVYHPDGSRFVESIHWRMNFWVISKFRGSDCLRTQGNTHSED